MIRNFQMAVLAIGLSATVGATWMLADDAETRAGAVSRYLDDQTLLVARVNLDQVNVAASFSEVLSLVRPPDGELDQVREAQQQGEAFLATLQRLGVSELYVLFDIEGLMRGRPCVVAPVDEQGAPRAVAGLLFSGNPAGPTSDDETGAARRSPMRFEVCQAVGDAVVCGTRDTIRRIRTHTAGIRPGLVEAFRAAGDGVVQVVAVPNAEHLRVLAEMAPHFAQLLGYVPNAEWTGGFRWAAVGFQSPPALAASLTIQGDSPPSAAHLQKVVKLAIYKLSQLPATRSQVPGSEQIAELLIPRIEGDRLVLSVSDTGGTADQLRKLLTPSVARARRATLQQQCFNNLKQLGLGMHNFHASYRSFPPAASYSDDGQPLLSWRVYLLPYLGYQELYGRFRLDEPWDSAHNSQLIAEMPPVFACPNTDLAGQGKTTYLAPLGEKTVFSGQVGMAIQRITDGTSNTILVVDAQEDQAVTWTKPADLQLDMDLPRRGLGGKHHGGFAAALCDGSVRMISDQYSDQTLRLLFMRNDGQPVEH